MIGAMTPDCAQANPIRKETWVELRCNSSRMGRKKTGNALMVMPMPTEPMTDDASNIRQP